MLGIGLLFLFGTTENPEPILFLRCESHTCIPTLFTHTPLPESMEAFQRYRKLSMFLIAVAQGTCNKSRQYRLLLLYQRGYQFCLFLEFRFSRSGVDPVLSAYSQAFVFSPTSKTRNKTFHIARHSCRGICLNYCCNDGYAFSQTPKSFK